MMDESKVKSFLFELTDLTEKYGLKIDSCDEVWLTEIDPLYVHPEGYITYIKDLDRDYKTISFYLSEWHKDFLNVAHEHSSNNKCELLESTKCGCFYCKSIFSPAEILEWVGKKDRALCPKCGIDSVLGDKSGFPVEDKDFLNKMYKYWFCSGIPVCG